MLFTLLDNQRNQSSMRTTVWTESLPSLVLGLATHLRSLQNTIDTAGAGASRACLLPSKDKWGECYGTKRNSCVCLLHSVYASGRSHQCTLFSALLWIRIQLRFWAPDHDPAIKSYYENIKKRQSKRRICTVLYCNCYLPFYISHYSPTLLQSWVHRPKIRNTNFNLSALSFLPDPEQIISDLGKCSGSNRIRIHNTEFSVYCSKCKSWLSWFVNHWLTLQTALSVPLLSSSCYFCCSLCLKILSHIFGWCHLPTAVTSRVISALFQYSSLTLKTKGADQASGMGLLIALCHWTLICFFYQFTNVVPVNFFFI